MKHKNPFIDQSALEGEDTPPKSEFEIMTEQAEENTEVVTVESYMVRGIGIGVALGIALGPSIFGNTGTGLGIGMLLGMMVGAAIKKNPARRTDGDGGTE